ncbi:MAG: hypothetical protein JNL74_15240, partial [Fibrobacteres bacterium]|nr:hypothetical protein [Fibrobacterota bacterium]
MKLLKHAGRLIVGLMLILFVHLPRLFCLLLLNSYYLVINYRENLTADPKEHLKRAKKLLKKKRMNSLLLYAALEIRFALERMVDAQLLFADNASNKMLKEYDPVKKKSYM